MFFGDIRPAWSHRYRSEARLTSGLVATCGSCTVGEFVESRNSAAGNDSCGEGARVLLRDPPWLRDGLLWSTSVPDNILRERVFFDNPSQ